MANRELVLALFPDEPAADSAAAALKDSDIADKDAVGILSLDAKGKLKQDKVGKRSTGKGAAIGGVIGVFSTAALGPAALVGAAAGALHHKKVGLSDADKARLTVELNSGKAAVAVMARPKTMSAITDRLNQLGGTPESHELSDDALTAAAVTDAPATDAPATDAHKNGRTRDELYEEARKMGVEGRSSMNKEQLREAVEAKT